MHNNLREDLIEVLEAVSQAQLNMLRRLRCSPHPEALSADAKCHMSAKIRLGISACLLGQAVRYDGGHKLDIFFTETLGKFVDYIPVCPEVECGMPVPREAMHLVGNPESPRLVTIRTGVDKTDRMTRWAKKRATELMKDGLMGFIFKSHSPSCGMEGVKICNEKNEIVHKGIGLFAQAFMKHFPLLPVEEEIRLQDPEIRDNFIHRFRSVSICANP
jgi:uncharacterized protein YbbK (DUF523 family)